MISAVNLTDDVTKSDGDVVNGEFFFFSVRFSAKSELSSRKQRIAIKEPISSCIDIFKMASRIIFNIIRIIFKYGRQILLCRIQLGLVRSYTIKMGPAPVLTYHVQGKRIATMLLTNNNNNNSNVHCRKNKMYIPLRKPPTMMLVK